MTTDIMAWQCQKSINHVLSKIRLYETKLSKHSLQESPHHLELPVYLKYLVEFIWGFNFDTKALCFYKASLSCDVL